MAIQRSAADKVADWLTAYRAIAAEITSPSLREMLSGLQGVDGATTPAEAIQLLQQSMALARLISANDRMAAMSAAVLTASGVSRPVVVDEEV